MNDDRELQNKLQNKLQELLNKEHSEHRKLSGPEKDQLKRDMLDGIYNGGTWFTTRRDNFLKIAYNETDNCFYARECVLKEGKTLEGGAYTFGTDWFDINFHGRRIDIYCDPETFQSWDIVCIPGRGTLFEGGEERVGKAKRLLEFCKEADKEVLAGIARGYHIDGAAFAKVISLSE